MMANKRPVRQVFISLAALIAVVLPGIGAAQAKISADEQLRQNGIEVIPERLVQYAAQGDLVTVNLLIDAGLPVSSADQTRKVTALHNASAQGHLRVVTRLLELGADVNARDWHGVTPMIAAAHAGHTSVVRVLLQKGADVNAVPQKAPTALIAAVQSGKGSMIDLLLTANAKPDVADGVGQTPLSAARRARRGDVIAKIEAALSKDRQ